MSWNHRQPEGAIPLNIHLLRAIKPGEQLRYYRGNFDLNIRQASVLPKTLRYARLLERVRAEAIALERAGRIKLSEKASKLPGIERIDRDGGAVVIEYTATGVAA